MYTTIEQKNEHTRLEQFVQDNISFIETIQELTVEVYGNADYLDIMRQYSEDSRDHLSTIQQWAIQFDSIYVGKEWDGDFIEAIEDFVAEKIKSLVD